MNRRCSCEGDALSAPQPLVRGSQGFGACRECGGDRHYIVRVVVCAPDQIVGKCEHCYLPHMQRCAVTVTKLLAGVLRRRDRAKLCEACIVELLKQRDYRGAPVDDRRNALAPHGDVR